MNDRKSWPQGKDFAFTIFDDTDYATIENVPVVYSLLNDLGFKTTKSVWPISGTGKPLGKGATCENDKYLKWILELKGKGFEIGYHMATFHTSRREETIAAIDKFASLIGNYPNTMSNHSVCEENIYWGSRRLSGINAYFYNLLTRYRSYKKYRGHIVGDELFWGDICKDRIKYVRNFVFPEANTLKACPFMPYHDPRRPFVNYWFASSEGPEIVAFNKTVSEKNQDLLEAEGGACIMYAHLACGFYKDEKIDPRFRSLMERLSRKNGWFVPVGTLIDYLLETNGAHVITDAERGKLERKWLRHKIRIGPS
ncbi:hypothetical protein ES703_50227 [subsurface metagenome]